MKKKEDYHHGCHCCHRSSHCHNRMAQEECARGV